MRCTNRTEFIEAFIKEAKEHQPKTERNCKPLINEVNQAVYKLMPHAMLLEYMNLKACNTGLTELDERRVKGAKEKILTLCHKFQVKPVFQGDPRGCAVAILCPITKQYNSMGGLESGFRLVFEGK